MMNDNLARQLINEAQPVSQPSKEPKKVLIDSKPLHKGLTRLEVSIISVLGMVFLALAVAHIALSMQVSTMNRSIQDLQAQATVVTVENQNLEQKVQELSRYDRVYNIAKSNDLEMNEEQIRNVFK